MTWLAWLFLGILIGVIGVLLIFFTAIGKLSASEEDILAVLKDAGGFPEHPITGDVHKWRNKEYIFTGKKWEEFKRHE